MLGVTQAVEATCGVSHQGLIENILPLGWGVVLAAIPDNPSLIPGAQMESGETPTPTSCHGIKDSIYFFSNKLGEK